MSAVTEGVLGIAQQAGVVAQDLGAMAGLLDVVWELVEAWQPDDDAREVREAAVELQRHLAELVERIDAEGE